VTVGNKGSDAPLHHRERDVFVEMLVVRRRRRDVFRFGRDFLNLWKTIPALAAKEAIDEAERRHGDAEGDTTDRPECLQDG
jgi:hypothetical protein